LQLAILPKAPLLNIADGTLFQKPSENWQMKLLISKTEHKRHLMFQIEQISERLLGRNYLEHFPRASTKKDRCALWNSFNCSSSISRNPVVISRRDVSNS
jgi:hypothetical protein